MFYLVSIGFATALLCTVRCSSPLEGDFDFSFQIMNEHVMDSFNDVGRKGVPPERLRKDCPIQVFGGISKGKPIIQPRDADP
jgi:hypothetical protein